MAAARKSSRYGHRDATMILIGYRHGLRASELCDLQSPDRPSSSAAGNRRGVKKRKQQVARDTRTQGQAAMCAGKSNGRAAGRDGPALPHRQPEEREMIAAISVFSQRRAFRRSTNIARRWGRRSILATRSALVPALRLLRLSRAAIGPYWSLPSWPECQHCSPLGPQVHFGHAFGASSSQPSSGKS